MRDIILLKVFRAHDSTNDFQKEECRALLPLAGSCVFRLQQNRASSTWSGSFSGKTSSTNQPYSFHQ